MIKSKFSSTKRNNGTGNELYKIGFPHPPIFIYLKGRITDGGRAMGSKEREEVLVVWTG